jgi:hypothetical protein
VQRFVWLVSSSWSPRLGSALQSVPRATAEPWQPRLPISASAATAEAAEIPQAMLEVASRPDCTWVLYCAPGVLWISSPAEALGDESDECDVAIVPNLLRPQATGGLPNCELEALRLGVFTHRFVAVRSSAEGRGFLRWWQRRLLEIPLQDRSPELWLHIAPALFRRVRVLRCPRFNIHRGNLPERPLDGSFPRVTVNGAPVAFLDLGVPGDLSPRDRELDPPTRRAFYSVVYWYEHRLGMIARSLMKGGASFPSAV